MTYNPNIKTYMAVNQYCDSRDLRSFLKSNFEHLKWKDKLRILHQIANGLHFIHDWAKMAHRDFHPGNILIDNSPNNENKIFISDFGLSFDILPQAEKPTGGIYGILPYVAPEVLDKKQQHTKASDVYSFGIVMVELSSGQPPFGDCEHDERLLFRICLGGDRPKCAEGTPECYLNIVEKCQHANPDERPTIIEIYSQISNWLDCIVKDPTTLTEQEFGIRKAFEEADMLIPKIAKSAYNVVHSGAVFSSSFLKFTNPSKTQSPKESSGNNIFEHFERLHCS